jgi:hypothetical protein
VAGQSTTVRRKTSASRPSRRHRALTMAQGEPIAAVSAPKFPSANGACSVARPHVSRCRSVDLGESTTQHRSALPAVRRMRDVGTAPADSSRERRC